jgi:Cupin domain.
MLRKKSLYHPRKVGKAMSCVPLNWVKVVIPQNTATIGLILTTLPKVKAFFHLDGKDYELEAGSFAYIPNGKIHSSVINGSAPFCLICIIPEERDV